jgi:hypothetical protein
MHDDLRMRKEDEESNLLTLVFILEFEGPNPGLDSLIESWLTFRLLLALSRSFPLSVDILRLEVFFEASIGKSGTGQEGQVDGNI